MKKQFYLFILLVPFFVHAQNVGIGTTNPLARLHVTDSNVIFSAPDILTEPVGFTLPVNGSGTRLMWIPKKGAFRAGGVFNNSWDADSIGTYSVAFGANTRAIGSGTFAMGTGSKAYGVNAIAMGNATTAFGSFSTAFGENTNANGSRSMSINRFTNAKGDYSFANGISTIALGTASQAAGTATVAKSYSSLAIGLFNDTASAENATSNISNDPLVYVGNGSSNIIRHNTLVIYKNGNVISKNPDALTIVNAPYNIPVTGSGTRMMWIPQRSAFRVGTVTGSQWDVAGPWSFAAGYNTIANGNSSISMGIECESSTDFGISIGSEAKSFANSAIAFGTGLTTQSYRSLFTGSYNTLFPSASTTSWVTTDPLFVIGNGTSNAARNHALIVYKNGNTGINGYTQLGEASPAIKTKELSVTLSGTAGVSTFVAHNVTASKIISLSALVTVGSFLILPNHSQTGFQYWCNVDGLNIAVTPVTGNSASVLNTPVKILITYKE